MLFVGCLVAAVCDGFVVAIACAMFCVIRGHAMPLLLSICHTPRNNTKSSPIYSAVPAIPKPNNTTVTPTEEAAVRYPARSQPNQANESGV